MGKTGSYKTLLSASTFARHIKLSWPWLKELRGPPVNMVDIGPLNWKFRSQERAERDLGAAPLVLCRMWWS